MRHAIAPTLTLLWLLSACSGPDSDLPPRYRRLEVPSGMLESAGARARGRVLFLRNCAHCHGERGDGRGIRSSSFARAPADLTQPLWRQRATPRRVVFVLREGVRGTPMPAWPSLSEAETWDLVAFVMSLAEPVAGAEPPAGR